MDRCPCCGKELKIEDYDTYYDPEVEDTCYYTLCSKCGYDSRESEVCYE